MAVREAEPVGSLQEVKEVGLDREDLLGIYRSMLITRGMEERGHILYKQGKIPGSFYTGRGNEAAAVGVATAMAPTDVGTPLHRDMGVHVVRGMEPWRVFAQYMGREDGPTRGRDGNVHMAMPELGLHTMVSHLPTMLRSRPGWLRAASRSEARSASHRVVRRGRRGTRRRARGDELRRRPPATHGLRLRHDQWAFSTPTYLAYPPSTSPIAPRPMASRVSVDGTDVLTSTAIRSPRSRRHAREGARPRATCLTLRWKATPCHDDAFYVPTDDVRDMGRGQGPIDAYRELAPRQRRADRGRREES